jgi:hypothetical protein
MPDGKQISNSGARERDADLRSLTQALNRVDDYAALGRTAIARLTAVDERLAQLRLRDTPFQRGRVASHLIHDAIAAHVPSGAGSDDRDAVEWTILYLRVHDSKPLEEIGEALSMPVRSVARYYARAKGLLLNHLLDLRFPTDGAGLHCPICGSPLPEAASQEHVCPQCGAQIRVTPDENGVLHLRVARDGPWPPPITE